MFDCFDHGGAGGGFENTWGTGKLMFTALQTPMVRIHNRPAYNSECHATREMGIGELNNSYEDAELADVHHGDRLQLLRDADQLLPGALGAEPAGRHRRQEEEVVPGRERRPRPRSSSSIRAARRPSPSPSRSPARTTCCIWTSSPAPTSRCSTGCSPTSSSRAGIDKDFIAKYTQGLRRRGRRPTSCRWTRRAGSPAFRSRSCSRPPSGPTSRRPRGQRPRTMHAYEKGIIWGNDNYLIQSALVDLVLATHNVGRRGTGVVRMGGHQEGYTRPPYPGDNKIYIDQEIIQGKGKMMTWWALQQLPDHATTPQQLREVVLRAQPDREGGDGQGARRDDRADGRRHLRRLRTRAGCSSPASTSTRPCWPRQRTCCCPPRIRAR